MTYLVVVLVVAGIGGAAWWRSRRPHHQVRLNDDYERAKSQAYLQAQHTRNNIGDPSH
jgi:hypothetical protein